MRNELEDQRARPPILKKAAAGLILVGAGALVIWLVVGIIKAIFWTVLVVAAVLAVLWAVKTLVW
jgi:hypothetical protein